MKTMNKLNIAMLGHKRIPSREGGIEIVVEELATRMAAMGHEVTCYNRGGHHVSGAEFDSEVTEELKQVRLETVWTLDKKGLAAVTASISAAFRSAFSKADVVHIHAEGPAVMCWLPRLMGKKVIVTVHGLDWQREKWKGSFGSKYIRLGEKMAVRWAHEIIVLSKNVQQYFEDAYGRKTVMIPNGVVKPEIREAEQITEAFGLTKDSYILQQGEDYSRITFYLTAGYYAAISYPLRLLWKEVVRARNDSTTSVFIVTTAERAADVATKFRKYNMGNYQIQGMCILDQDQVGQSIAGIPVMATRETLLKYLSDKWMNSVFFSLPVEAAYPSELINTITEMGIVVHIQVEQMYVEEWQRQTVEKIAGTTVRTLSMTMATPQELFWKRALDILGGIAGCMITLLLTLIVGPMIYIKSPGPIFFKQTRVGKNGKLFKMYKFRSMYLDAEARKAELMAQNRVQGGLMFKLEYDPRIIGCEKRPDGTIKKGIGNFIRDYSLDEFPQFFNVLKGDLSLCGTRPPTVDEWEKYELHHRARLAIKPGITGLWQISGRSNITDFEQVVELDKKYIREWSMGLDLKILLKTVLVVLGKEGSM